MIFESALPKPSPARGRIEAAHRISEAECLPPLIEQATFSEGQVAQIDVAARGLVDGLRAARRPVGGIDIFLQEYGLSTAEGITLMCLAESLLRVPDDETADRLIRDKIGGADWAKHLGQSSSLFVNASTWGLMLTGAVVELDRDAPDELAAFLRRLVRRSGEPVIREALRHAMRIIGRQFVMGRTIEEALSRSHEAGADMYRYSFDMLGEGARTAADATRYFDAYQHAIAAVGASGSGDLTEVPGISIKLSAFHPRYEFAQRERVFKELTPRLIDLCRQAKDVGIALCIDAEEADRLSLSLDILERIAAEPSLRGWDGLGLAVQAYQKRAFPLIDWLGELAASSGRRFMVRLVKGAYWDTEIKRTQQGGYPDYPVFTRKEATDVSYLACARKLLEFPSLFYPQFATHNAHTVAAVAALATRGQPFEYQRLHGMGGPLYDQVVSESGPACRVYAPVGSHEALLAYLVRRLLENGANTSFVNRIADDEMPVERVIADPAIKLASQPSFANPLIDKPEALFGPERGNSTGVDISDLLAMRGLQARLPKYGSWRATPIVGGAEVVSGTSVPVLNPSDRLEEIGQCYRTEAGDIEVAITAAYAASPAWDRTPASERGRVLETVANLLEQNREELFALCIREAGKTLGDAVAEVREAVDFCRYYAQQAQKLFSVPLSMPGVTGERNELSLHGRGVFACISPWNFPLAIFIGQISAALAAGNAVIAKPAEQTSLIATRVVSLMFEAGVPAEVLHLLPGDGAEIGGVMIADPRIAGVAFTGSLATAQRINRGLAARPGAIVPLIAETGGQNVMIVDSTALHEQVIDDAINSAFQSAGQRCSALRCLFIQDDIADDLIAMLVGRAREIVVGDPAWLNSDVGPVIDEVARERLVSHVARMSTEATLHFEATMGIGHESGTFFAPRIYEVDGLDQLPEEVFGPILHIVRYAAEQLNDVIRSINESGFGLTLGIHSRVGATVRYIQSRVRVGNIYVNRNMIGAVVGSQPFGGEGLSGTGPKAGGPHYLTAFAVERSISEDTTATGGNTELLSTGGNQDT